MAAILDQYGNTISSGARRFVRGADNGGRERPWENIRLGDIDQLVPQQDHQTLVYVSRRLYANMGIVKGAIDQRAMYAVGRAWLPKFQGEDKEWGSQAADWLQNEWFSVCDVRGQSHDWQTGLYLDSVHIDRDGDVGIMLTETDTGYPQIQRIPAHRIGGRYNVGVDPQTGLVTTGPWRGYRMVSGVIVNKQGRAIAYRILGDASDGSQDVDVSAQDLIFPYDPSWHEAQRGHPVFSHALNDLRDMLQSHDWERMAQLAMSSIALVEYNEDGGPDISDPMNAFGAGTTSGDSLTTQSLSGGLVRYFKSNSGGKLEGLRIDRPGDVWESFQDRMIRSSLAGIPWPASMLWMATGQGTAERADLQRADRAVQDRQDLLKPLARRMVGYAVSKAIKLGILPQYKGKDAGGFLRWDFSTPPRISIDIGRDSKALIEGWRSGMQNHSGIITALGSDLRTHYAERAEEVALRKLAAQEASAKYGVEVTPEEMAVFDPSLQSPNAQPAQPQPQ